MYLYLYINEQLVGNVDIEVMFASKTRSTLIVTDEKGAALLGSLELMYGKHIEKFTPAEAWGMRSRESTPWSKTIIPAHIYTTSKVGPVLKWDDHSCALCV